jgi:AcrR family transcriptional regulator
VLHHFASRDALLAAVAEGGFDALHAALREATRTGSARDGFRKLDEAYVSWALRHGHLYRLMFASRLRERGAHPALDARADALFTTVAEQVSSAQAAGELAAGPPGETAFFAWSTAHGVSLLLLDDQTGLPALAGQSRKALIAAALDGVRRASVPPSTKR